MQQLEGISYTKFYGDLVYKFKKIIGNPNFSDLFLESTRSFCKSFQESRAYFRHYAADCMLSFNPIMVEGYAALFKLHGGGSGLRLNDSLHVKL